MRDYWLTQSLLQAVGIGFGLLALTGLALALWLPKKWWGKLLGVAVVVFLISIPVSKVMQEQATQQVKADDYKERYAKARALFDERCKTAGEKIYRTVENVEGVFLMKVRPNHVNMSEQYAMDDPYGADCHGEQCIIDLLNVSRGAELNPQLAIKLNTGFSFVDAIDATDGRRYRYRGLIDSSYNYQVKLEKSLTEAPTPTYGITYEDISTKPERDNWIAGGYLAVLDLQKNTVLAKRKGYMMDAGLGSTTSGRTPWGFAYDIACPRFPTVSDGRAIRIGHTRKFVPQVLQSTKGK